MSQAHRGEENSRGARALRNIDAQSGCHLTLSRSSWSGCHPTAGSRSSVYVRSARGRRPLLLVETAPFDSLPVERECFMWNVASPRVS